MKKSLKNVKQYLIILILLQPSLVFCQSNCDTIFTTKGDTLLINPDYSKFKKTIIYAYCGENRALNQFHLTEKEITRISGHKLKRDSLKKSIDNVDIKIKLLDNTIIKGKLLGLKDTSILVQNGSHLKDFKNANNMTEYKVSDIDIAKIINKRNRRLALAIGVFIGGGLGVKSSNGGDFGEDYVVRGIAGALIGGAISLGICRVKLNINGNQKNYSQYLEKGNYLY